MSEKKFAKNIVTEDLMPPFPEPVIKRLDEQEKEGKHLDRTLITFIEEIYRDIKNQESKK